MKLNAGIGAEQHTVTLTRNGSRVAAEIDGRSYELEARRTANGSCLLLHEGRVFDCLTQGPATNGGTVTVGIGGREFAVTLTDPKRIRAGAGAGLQQSGRLTAQMPGKVARVMAAEGDEVTEGAPILVVEAMKMQNEMKAPCAGVVKKINVAEGATVNAGDVLAIIE